MQEGEGTRVDEGIGESRDYCRGRCCRHYEEDSEETPASSRKMLHAPVESGPADGLNCSDRVRTWSGRAIRGNSDACWDRQMQRC